MRFFCAKRLILHFGAPESSAYLPSSFMSAWFIWPMQKALARGLKFTFVVAQNKRRRGEEKRREEKQELRQLETCATINQVSSCACCSCASAGAREVWKIALILRSANFGPPNFCLNWNRNRNRIKSPSRSSLARLLMHEEEAKRLQFLNRRSRIQIHTKIRSSFCALTPTKFNSPNAKRGYWSSIRSKSNLILAARAWPANRKLSFVLRLRARDRQREI